MYLQSIHRRDNVQINSDHRRRTRLPQLGAAWLAILASAGCSTGTRVPVHSGVAALHAEEHPECTDVTASSGPMGVSSVAHVQVNACGLRTDYICTTDSFPDEDVIDHSRARCAPADSLRGAAMRTLERSDQPSSIHNSPPLSQPVRHPEAPRDRIPPRPPGNSPSR